MNRSAVTTGALLLVLAIAIPQSPYASTKVVSAKAAPAKKTGSTKVAVATSGSSGSSVKVTVNEGGVFTVVERDQIILFYKRNKTIVTDVKPLPPGIAKNLARGKPLPPGIAKKRLPRALESALPRREYLRIQVGPDVVAIDGSGRVLDILRGVFAG
jgi:hypothetical protein